MMLPLLPMNAGAENRQHRPVSVPKAAKKK